MGGDPTLQGNKAKPRFSHTELKVLLEAIKRNRYILLRKFNDGVSAEAKKNTWCEITEQINSLGENQREVRQIMKKWADLKFDAKRRVRGPNKKNFRRKNLGPIEKAVHKLLSISPKGDGDSDIDLDEDPLFCRISLPETSSYSDSFTPDPSATERADVDWNQESPDYGLDLEEEDDEDHLSLMESEDFLRSKPTHTYSRQERSPPSSQPAQSSPTVELAPPSTTLAKCLQQQQTGRVLLASVARSVESLAHSLQQLRERQQEFVRESLLLQRQTVETLRDFSNTALTMLQAAPQSTANVRYMYK